MDVINSHCISESRDWAKDRKFMPSQRYAANINLNRVEIHDHDNSFTYWTYIACEYAEPCTCCGIPPPHLDCIVIAVDGACRRNGTADARAAVGVFVAKQSEHNMSFVLTDSKATNQIAELRAGILGLEQAISIRNKG
ncbi:hypothetical protein M431DRAFT_514402 [Trichoderma harzianum CBS 226.95]|uniref:RNase H type-1 domain-containing protein n=1 Tax=Trichoderma harzianum CBS 226.95 TaxID=983964 RepID=A0A2T3ZRJ4_TRIHA|nr:hypothetical protein M431DRAFT_514402 [Trichoderma harzianum CBS 226.95]PTB47402.1 hypothetical protein M431DRAFT_514402 [Trichoderma harzianum CBS 226.95]